MSSYSQYFFPDVQIQGNLDITQDLSVNAGKITTALIQNPVPNSSLVVQANGLTDIFDIQTAITRSKTLEVNTNLFLPNGGSGLDWYEEYTSSGNQWTGIWAADISGEYAFGRIGKMVCVKIPFVIGIATMGGTITNTIAFPAQFRPSLMITGVIVIIDNATQNIASYSIDNTGIMTITAAPNGTTFSGAGLSGIPLTACLSYSLV